MDAGEEEEWLNIEMSLCVGKGDPMIGIEDVVDVWTGKGAWFCRFETTRVVPPPKYVG